MIIKQNMQNITANQNNEQTGLVEPLPEMRQMLRDERLREMVRIWTMLSLSQKEALIHEATRAWCLNQTIDPLLEMQMAALKAKEVSAKDR